ncbi:Mu-like prophage I protein [Mycobacteroides abscessus subsp. abscessus]|uniref:hypothetical protein n=1 Tax=Mycobacteroides TaxID=670516 RepID=UPI0009A69CE0|nr:hypothetical protein [Mycobacteroides abscessus]SKZ42858.1 Mu-like prophage I protein [Mycobacteroides abscessus subsp. abscessus]
MAFTLTDEQSTQLLDVLGLPADTTDPTLVLATAADLATQAEGVDPAKPSTVAAAAAKAGLEVLDSATVAALRHDAAQGRQLAAAAMHARVEASVDDAIAKGKITAPRRKHWVTLIEADAAMADVLASIPNETAIPMTELGHSADDIATADKPAWFY